MSWSLGFYEEILIHKRVEPLVLFTRIALRSLLSFDFSPIGYLALKLTLDFTHFPFYLHSHFLHPRVRDYFGGWGTLLGVELKDLNDQILQLFAEITAQLIVP
jgi:hypothetical protein